METLLRDPSLIIAVASGLIALVALWLAFDLRKKWQRVFGGSPAPSGVKDELFSRMVRAEERLDVSESRISALEGIGRIAVQRVGFKRFNPFAETGGNQSFALCLLDGEENGIVISSLYTREGVRVYAKEIKNGAPQQQLSDEEAEVLAQALKSEA